MAFNNVKEVKWTSRSNQIHEYKVDLKVMHNAKMTGGKDLLYLKVNTTLKKPIQFSEDLIRVTKEFLKLHKDVFLTLDFFVKIYTILAHIDQQD